jgi:imidazolonepropionase-like amidohydrolase
MTSLKRRVIMTLAAAFTTGLIGQTASATSGDRPLLIKADLLFDGTQFRSGQAVLVRQGKIVKVAPADQINAGGAQVISVPGGTILPGFIDMHTHHLINGIPPRRMLEHGVTTARDLGSAEPLTPAATNQAYELRQLLSGPILQARGGYPNVVFPGSGVEVTGESNARAKVDSLVAQGASVIAVSLEIGGEFGAPWGWHEASAPPPWPTLSTSELNAIVDQAHNVHHLKVTAYLGTSRAAQRALDAGIDEWAHAPCNPLSADVLEHPGIAGLAIDGTLDTEIKCKGALDNAAALVGKGAKLFYSTDMGHLDIPHGIDAQEVHMGLHVGFHNGLAYPDALASALASATSEGGKYLGLAPLGQIVAGAPADLIVISSDVRANFKELEFPRLVVKDGIVVIKRGNGE